MKNHKIIALTAFTVSALAVSAQRGKLPNIVVMVADDYGYSDNSTNPFHAPQVSTPNIDRIARTGVNCTNGYVSAHISSATRAGLMTGMYQQRFGLYTAGEAGSGLDMSATIFPQYLKKAGYVSGQFGKWHLGPDPEWSPYKRGFDYQFGFLGRGAHDYYKLDDPTDPIYRNDQVVSEKGYLTDVLARDVSKFIVGNKNKPFFAYVAFNAVHTPLQAPRDEIIKFDTGDSTRNVMLAMGKRLDDAVGEILNTLEKNGLRQNTIVFFISDNGGSLGATSENKPLNGGKHMDYEGGIRVPFFVSWPTQIKAGTVCETPVISLDILPTCLKAVSIIPPAGTNFDGIDILPVITGKSAPERPMFWCGGSADPWWAIRKGDWKIVGNKENTWLFNLHDDIGEKNDLKAKNTDKFNELKILHDKWLAEMKNPVGENNHKRWDPSLMKKKATKNSDKPAPNKFDMTEKKAAKMNKAANEAEKKNNK
ncbi:N-acetylgalactosamine-6-sulfatase [Bacteroidia bacterium]|nr:N-acetylgalactosamine-6-sulfatase [Bacteroidia bacterium]